MKTYVDSGIGTRGTPQTEPIPGSSQVANSAGGFSFQVDRWTQLMRFLVLGTEGGTYYITEKKLTKDNALVVQDCIKEDGVRVVNTIVEVSDQGRAFKNDPAVFALAVASALGNEETKKAAFAALNKVCRTATHLFHFVAFRRQFAGWGPAFRRAVRNWYLERELSQTAYQVTKYRQRDGWDHKDLLHLAHMRTADPCFKAVFDWIEKDIKPSAEKERSGLNIIIGYEAAKAAETEGEILDCIRNFGLTREMVPTEWLKSVKVWDALLEKMPLGAMIRNLAVMTRVGLIAPGSDATALVAARIRDGVLLKVSRIHPLGILAAMAAYSAGGAYSRSKGETYVAVPRVVDALDAAFYTSFKNVEPTGKNTLLAIDISGSMGAGLSSLPGLSCKQGAMAMALVTANVEENHRFVGFDRTLIDLPVSPNQRLDDVMAKMPHWGGGSTDCSAAINWAIKNNVKVEVFNVYTDSETYAGHPHPSQALQQYREKTGIPAKLAVIGMVGNPFTIADPNDAGMLDCVGMDVSTPAVLSDFARGNI